MLRFPRTAITWARWRRLSVRDVVFLGIIRKGQKNIIQKVNIPGTNIYTPLNYVSIEDYT